MNRKQAIDVLETIDAFYPKVKMDKRKTKILIPTLMKMGYQGVMNNLSAHVANYVYPPTIAEIASYEAEPNPYIDEEMIGEKEAQQVPEEVKEEFLEEFGKLVEKIDGNSKL